MSLQARARVHPRRRFYEGDPLTGIRRLREEDSAYRALPVYSVGQGVTRGSNLEVLHWRRSDQLLDEIQTMIKEKTEKNASILIHHVGSKGLPISIPTTAPSTAPNIASTAISISG